MKIKKTLQLMFLCLLFALLSFSILPMTLAGFDDVNTCQPLRPPTKSTITVGVGQAQKLPNIVNKAASGTTILLEDGTYVIRSFLRFSKGRVTLRSVSGNRETVIIDGEYKGYLIQIAAPYITIADMTLKRAKNHLVHVVGNARNVTLHNLYLVDARQQFVKVNPASKTYPDFGTLACSHFELTDTGRQNVDPVITGCYTGGLDAISVQGWKVRDNFFENIYCTNGGLPTHMILFWKTSRTPLVERNMIVNCARGIGFGLGSAGDHRKYPDDPISGIEGPVGHIGGMIRNNFIFGDIGNYFDTGIGLEQAWNVAVFNNTVYSTGETFSSIDSRFPNTNIIVTNNLVKPKMTIRGKAKPVFTNNVNAEPDMFVDINKAELHLKKTAAQVINQGKLLEELIADDFDGDIRDSSPDIGADEYVRP